MEFRQSLSMGQELSHKQSQELRMQQTLVEWDDIERELVGDPQDLLNSVIDYAVGHIEHAGIRGMVQEMLTDGQLRAVLLSSAESIASNPSDAIIAQCALDWIYESHRGRFDFETNGQHSESVELVKGSFTRAFFNPESLAGEIQSLTEFAQKKDRNLDLSSLMASRRELVVAQAVIAGLRESVDAYTIAIKQALGAKSSDGSRPLMEFLSDLTALRNARFIISDRMEKRFAQRFIKMSRLSKPEEFETAFLNSIAEYTLVGMGTLDPELFKPYRGEIVERLRFTGSTEQSANRIANRVGNPARIFHWQRWNVIGKQHTPVTDALIRDFITRRVREEKDSIISAFMYTQLFWEIKDEIYEPNGKRIPPKKSLEKCIELIHACLGSTQGRAEVVRFARTKWIGDLNKISK